MAISSYGRKITLYDILGFYLPSVDTVTL